MCVENTNVNFALIDLSGAVPTDVLVERLRDACENHGFFMVTGHGIDVKDQEKLLRIAREFFALPVEKKNEIVKNESGRGYMRFGLSTGDPKNSKHADTNEAWFMGREVTEREIGLHPTLGPNQYPDEAYVPNFREAVERYYERMSHVGARVAELLSLALGLDKDYIATGFGKHSSNIRMNHYSAQMSDIDDGQYALGAHTDFGCVSYVLTDGQPGLEAFLGGKWQDVSAPAGALICNIGDMLQISSNGRFKSTLHRVINKTGTDRYSIPFFYQPAFDARISSPPELGPPKFPTTTFGEHFLQKFNAIHAKE